MYVEVAAGGDPPDHTGWLFVAKPWPMFPSLEMAKAFLFGRAKYGPLPGWEPVRELRGIPDDLSSDVELRREASDMTVADPTWLTLGELRSIDLDVPMGIPDDPAALHDRTVRRYAAYTLVSDDETEERADPRAYDAETVYRALEDGRVEVDDGALVADRTTRRNYARGYEDLLAFMGDLCDGRYATVDRSPDGVRLVTWIEY